jgi:hypothetical protein
MTICMKDVCEFKVNGQCEEECCRDSYDLLIPEEMEGKKLTREQIMSMEPGRELDALVAEKVMGWIKYIQLDVSWWSDSDYLNDDGIDLMVCDFKPSTNLQQAFEVVEKMRERGWYEIRISILQDVVAISMWQDDNTCRIEAEAETIPLAICRASLLAIIEEGGDGSE